MIFLDEIAQYIESQGFAQQGTDLFIMKMPHDIDNGILLIDRTAGSERFKELPGYRKTRFRAILRGTDLAVLPKRAFDLAELLDWDVITDTGRVEFKELYPVNDPVIFPLSDGHYHEAAINFQTAYHLHTPTF